MTTKKTAAPAAKPAATPALKTAKTARKTARPVQTVPALSAAQTAADDTADTAATATAPKGTIAVQGRIMPVKRPSPEQLGMWQITASELNNLDASKVGAARAAKLLARAIRLITSVLADQDDRDWVQDQILEGELALTEAAQILPLAGAQYAAAAAAAQRTGPVSQARRHR